MELYDKKVPINNRNWYKSFALIYERCCIIERKQIIKELTATKPEEEAPVPPGLLRAPQWFYSVDGTAAMQRGPLGTAELQWKYTNGDLPEYAVAWHPLLTQGWVPLAEIPELQSSSGGGGGGQSSPSAASLAAEEVPELQGRSRLRNMVGRRAHRVERLLPAVKEGETTVLLERTEPGYMRQKETSPLRRLVKSTK